MSNGVNRFEVDSDLSKRDDEELATMLTLRVSQWETFDTDVPHISLNGKGTGFDCYMHFRRVEDLEQFHNEVTVAYLKHKARLEDERVKEGKDE